jgi:hypothetical protein
MNYYQLKVTTKSSGKAKGLLCLANVLASSEEEAIQMVKSRFQQTLSAFSKVDVPLNHFDNAKIEVTTKDKPEILNFLWDMK